MLTVLNTILTLAVLCCKEKKTLPDIDIDFETDRRQEVIDYVIHKYKGKAIQICSYGMYGIDNLVNDLAGVCGLKTTKEVDEYEARENKQTIAENEVIY